MIGSDNKFNETIRHLFENPELDVVGAPYLTWQGHRPPGEEIILVGAPLSGWADEGLTPARYVGMDCTRIRREVIEQIEKFRTEYNGTHGIVSRTEDVILCDEAAALGFKIWLDDRIQVGHYKLLEMSDTRALPGGRP